jgi:predicted metal-dependent enzyme (double-stranded beta helix superfamily)
MNAAVEKKPTNSQDKKNATGDVTILSATSPSGTVINSVKDNSADLREAIRVIDADRTELVKKTIENIKPGKPFDSSVVREINKLETKKNRLIVAHFASLLRKNSEDVHSIVHQIIEL